jgi:hypothetical protein
MLEPLDPAREHGLPGILDHREPGHPDIGDLTFTSFVARHESVLARLQVR